MTEYYIKTKSGDKGPVSIEKLIELADSRKITPETQIRPSTHEGYIRASKLHKLFFPRHAPVDCSLSPPEDAMNPILLGLRNEYHAALNVIDEVAPQLIREGREYSALCQMLEAGQTLLQIQGVLTSMYQAFFDNLEFLRFYESKRLISLDHPPIRLRASFDNSDSEDVERQVGRELRSLGFTREHPLLKAILLSEIEYMIFVLGTMVEQDYVPDGHDDDVVDRGIASEVKRAVWRRDRGKCVECSSRERLEYDHIIPVAKGGSNTERNVQLLCERCNRRKAAQVAVPQ